MKIGLVLGYFSPVFGAVTSEKPGNPVRHGALDVIQYINPVDRGHGADGGECVDAR